MGRATIGKRTAGIRVIARDGGPLGAGAVFARNLTRDLEFFLPLTALVQPRLIVQDAPTGEQVQPLAPGSRNGFTEHQ